MYSQNKRKMCHCSSEELDDSDYTYTEERSLSTGSVEKWTRFSDGTSKLHGGPMCDDMYFDEYGEEC